MSTAEPSLPVCRAEAEVAKLAESFGEWMGDYLAQARAALAEANGDAAAHKALFAAVHNIKGLGGTFGYSLVTGIADNLCVDLRRRERLDAGACRLALAHLDALAIVLKHDLKGDGGQVGAAVFTRLRGLIQAAA
jgi:DNA-directed RNA polymerase specialized sigma24 family protein